ncbi:hypothetical protein [Actinomadura sp. 6N118]|uniref:hypothetical protein n=1 Tax=Actinomadura sp. 6N118 TaxID=3375151 RepID=UPI0037947034
MRSLKRSAIAVGAAGAVLASIVANASAATADAGWTVSPGGQIASVNTTQNFIVRNVTRGLLAYCQETEVSGTAQSGTGLPGQSLMAFDFVRFGGWTGDPEICHYPFGALQVFMNDMPVEFDAVSHDTATGVTTGFLVNGDAPDGVGITGSLVGLDDGCELSFGGSGSEPGKIGVTYTNPSGGSKGRLVATATGNIVAKNVNNKCPANFYQNGDRLTFEGPLLIGSDQVVTSP